MIRMLLVVEGRLVRGALAYLLSEPPDMEVVGEVDSFAEAEAIVHTARPAVTVIDLFPISVRDLSALCVTGEAAGRSRVLALIDRRHAGRFASAMARRTADIGFLSKDVSAQRVIDGVRRLARGEPVLDGGLVAAALGATSPLTARECEVLETTAEGCSVREIATRFGLSPGTVRNHLSRICAKTGAMNRIQAVQRARESGWI